MIYGYKYKKHVIEEFHKGIMFFFKYLIDNSPASFDRDLMFPKLFVPMMKASNKKFDPFLEKLVLEYTLLNASQKKKVKQAFDNNNKIEELCNGKLSPVKYSDLEANFAKSLRGFLDKLWEEYPHNDSIKNKYKKVQSHFDAFTNRDFQKAIICPFCGLNPLKPSEGKGRNAYDHYLPKSLYPFTSVNFINLVPICTDCNNKGEKGDKDVLYRIGTRRKLFYPFDKSLKSNKLKFEISPKQKYDPRSKSTSLRNIKWDYTIKVNDKIDPRVKTWEDIFGVKRRYKEFMPSMETEWFGWLKDRYKESIRYKIPFHQFKKDRLAESKKQIDSMDKGMMRYSYIHFVLSQKDIKKKLNHFIK
jgi:5-methylcytosine-specific restriction endonuclease McrA